MEEKYTFCHICTNHCALKAKIEDGKVIDVRGAGELDAPLHMCSIQKGPDHLMGTVNASERIEHPLKRKGERGEGEWEQISWNEALDTIANKFNEIKDNYGPERVVMIQGEPKGMEYAFGQRFACAFGTPNVISPGNICGVMTSEAYRYTFGSQTVQARTEKDPEVIIIWGANIAHTGGSFTGIKRCDFNSAVGKGTRIVVIDPKDIEIWPEKNMLASDADYWLKPRPNSDGILAMGMIKVVIEEGLYDKDYIEGWTEGFEELREEVKSFELDEVEEMTWVPKEQIQEVARLYAKNKPGIIGWGNALENNSQSFQICRAVAILRGITGNVNTPNGGEVEMIPAGYYRPGRFMLGDLKERLKKYPRSGERTIGGEFNLARRAAFVPRQSLMKALLEGEPYKPKAAYAMVTNPLVTYPNSEAVKKAFDELELFVVSEIFHTRTTEVADIVLPAAPIHEHDTIAYWPAWYGEVRAHPKLVDPPGEAWSDMKIINELAKRVGLGEYFWEDEKEALDYMLEPLDIAWEEFRDEIHHIGGERNYDPEEVSGYDTPSGKVELYSEKLEEMEAKPLPRFEDLKEPIRGKFETTDEYPLMMTSYKSDVFMLSGYRNVDRLKKKSLPPTAYMNTEKAEELGLEEGDWIIIETPHGKAKQKLSTDPKIDPRIVNTEFGWGNEEYRDSNINTLTDYTEPYDSQTGTETLRGYPCKVYKA